MDSFIINYMLFKNYAHSSLSFFNIRKTGNKSNRIETNHQHLSQKNALCFANSFAITDG